jgi:hypothetical protein
MSATCDNGDMPGNVTLGAGQTVTCTFENAKQISPPPVNPPVTPTPARLINLSSRGWAGSGDALLIDGFILGGGDAPRQIIVRALGPSLTDAGLADPLANPRLRVTTVDGQPIAENDDWMQAPNAAELERLGYAPAYPQEAALLLTLDPRVPYTVLVRGVNGTTGLALLEILELP